MTWPVVVGFTTMLHVYVVTVIIASLFIVLSACIRYVLEIFGGHFSLPDLGPIGANGLANARDFLTPRACFEDTEAQDHSLVNKFCGEWFISM